VAEAEVATVSVELPPAVTLVGLSEAVAPLGRLPVAVSETVPAEPIAVVLMVLVPLEPWGTLTEVGLALIEKSLGGGDVLAGLKPAIPSAQYIDEPNVPVKLCGLADVSASYPVMTVSIPPEVVFTCG